jgi:tight adherence protein B
MVVALPYEMVQGGRTPLFSLIENGVGRDVVAVAPGESGDREPIDVVLVLDTSGSMSGRPLREAQAAARDFVESMGAEDRIALVTYSVEPEVVVPYTRDRLALASAISSVRAEGETALYDALSEAASLARGAESPMRYIVLLSDGADDSSDTTLDAVAAELSKAGAPVYSVALSSPDYEPAAVSSLAKRTRGTSLSTQDARELSGIFKSIARDIQDVWSVSYRSAAPETPDLEIVLTAHRGDMKARAVALVDNPVFAAGAPVAPPRVRFGGIFSLIGWNIALFAGVAVALLVVGVGLLLLKEGTAIDQLSYYRQIRSERRMLEDGESAADQDGIRWRLKKAVDEVAGRRGFTADLKVRIERAGMKIRPNEFIYFHLGGVIMAGILAQVLAQSILVSGAVAVVTAFAPFAIMNMRASRRRAQFDAQLPDILALISGSLRAGWGIQQAVDLIVEETTEPARTEFKRVQSETRLGLSLEESLAKMAVRLDSEDFRWVVAAIGIQREVGGNLAEVLDIAAGTIRERAELRRQVSALTAEGRFSAIVLVVLPFLMLAALGFIAPRYLSNLTLNIEGLWMLGGGGVLLLIGSIWLMRISKIEV